MDVTDFQRDVIERSRSIPVLVDFWAAWCGPCRVLGPVLERLASEAGGRWELAKVDTEAHPDVAAEYGVMGIPSVKLFVDGVVVDEFAGALPERDVRRWLERALPAPQASEIEAASSALARGAWSEAARDLEGVLAATPSDPRARVMLAEALLHLDPEAVAAHIQSLESDLDFSDRAQAIGALARLVVRAEQPGAFPAGPARSHLLEAAAAVKRGDWALALTALIEALRLSRDYADGAAREAGRAIFTLLGQDHPIVERFHRGYSSALHA
jgi:putative thioredoxin